MPQPSVLYVTIQNFKRRLMTQGRIHGRGDPPTTRWLLAKKSRRQADQKLVLSQNAPKLAFKVFELKNRKKIWGGGPWWGGDTSPIPLAPSAP